VKTLNISPSGIFNDCTTNITIFRSFDTLLLFSFFRPPRLHTLIHNVGTEKRREKVFVLGELQRAIINTRELSKQAIEDHVSTAFTVYSVN
jgi:hypothetical protein